MPTLKQSMEQHTAYKLGVGLSQGTVDNNWQAFNSFISVIGDIQCESLRSEHVDKWFAKRLTQVAASTANRDLSTIKVWLAWAQRYGHLKPGLYAAGVRRVKSMPVERMKVPVEKFPLLLDSALDPVARMVIATGLYLFCRQSEIKTIRHCDVDLARGSIHIRVWKTRQVDDMPICAELDAELRRYLSWRATQAPLHPMQPLIPARAGGQWASGRDRRTPVSLQVDKPMHRPYQSVQWALEAAGFGDLKGEGCHTLRRSGARALYDALCGQGHDRSIRYVQRMLHHSSVAMTEHYLGITADETATNRLLRGKPMFGLQADNVIQLRPNEAQEETWPVAL